MECPKNFCLRATKAQSDSGGPYNPLELMMLSTWVMKQANKQAQRPQRTPWFNHELHILSAIGGVHHLVFKEKVVLGYERNSFFLTKIAKDNLGFFKNGL